MLGVSCSVLTNDGFLKYHIRYNTYTLQYNPTYVMTIVSTNINVPGISHTTYMFTLRSTSNLLEKEHIGGNKAHRGIGHTIREHNNLNVDK